MAPVVLLMSSQYGVCGTVGVLPVSRLWYCWCLASMAPVVLLVSSQYGACGTVGV